VRDRIITMRDRAAGLSGAVTDVDARFTDDYTVILFAADERLWAAPARVTAAALAPDGRFSFLPIRPGHYRLAVVRAVEPDEWLDPAFLRRWSR
jgi:hypothetical protein